MGLNSPLPSSLRDECRKAAKILNSFVDTHNNGLDKVIPRYILERAHGFAIFTVAKAGFLFSARAGSGLVIARTADGSWSPPSGIAVGGVGFGGQAGAEVTDFLIVLNSRAAVANFMSAGSLTLGGNMSLAVGPLGRNAEGSGALNTKGQMAAMYSYSKTKGLFGGVSLEGTVIAERQDANRLAYGGSPTAKQILTGAFDPPDWAYTLIDVLDRTTGLPGGQTWVEERPEEKGAMGWQSPYGGKTGSGYAFGEGVGAGGTASSNRKRSSSLFSIGGNKSGRDDAAASAMFYSNPATAMPSPQHTGSGRSRGNSASTPLEERPPPARPWENRRASSLVPFSKSMNFANFGKDKDRKMGPSSETYNSTFDTERDEERVQRRSSVVRPYKEKPTPSPFLSDLDPSRSNTPRSSPPRSFGRRSPISGSDRSSSSDRDRDLLGSDEWVGGRDTQFNGNINAYATAAPRKPVIGADLLGSWDADPHGLTANFGKMSTSHNEWAGNGMGMGKGLSPGSTPNRTPNRSRKSSRASQLPFDVIAEDPNVQVHETSSAYATRDWTLPSDSMPAREKKKFFRERKERPFSSYAAPTGWSWREHEEEERSPRARDETDLADDYAARPFDDYLPKPRSAAPKPNLSLKAGLDRAAADGYARAVALFDFNGTADGDLSLRKGQVVAVIDSDGDAGEWWKGRGTDGSEGLFPANYVEVLDIPQDLRGGISKSTLRRRVLAFDL